MGLAAAPRPCTKCRRILAADYFHKYDGGTYAARCKDCRLVRPNGPQGIITAPHPCAACGGPIRKDEPPSRLLSRKTCSAACANAVRRRQNRTCSRCKRLLGFDAFGKSQHSRHRRPACLECCDDIVPDPNGGYVLRPSLHEFRRKYEETAHRRGIDFKLTGPQLRQLHQAPCSLCAKAVSGLLLKVVQLGYRKDNVRPVCRVCKRLAKVVGYQELLLLSHEIAAHVPLLPQDARSSNGQARKRRLPRARPKPTKAAPAWADYPGPRPGATENAG